MTIYGRFHSAASPDVVVVERVATLDDVKRLGDCKSEARARFDAESGDYVVVKTPGEHPSARLYHLRSLRADGGEEEISAAIAAVKAASVEAAVARTSEFEAGQVVREGRTLGIVLQAGRLIYDVAWVGGSVSRYRRDGGRDVWAATDADLAGGGKGEVEVLRRKVEALRRGIVARARDLSRNRRSPVAAKR